MSTLGLTLVIVCGALIFLAACAGLAEELGGIDPVTMAFAAVVIVVFFGVLGGFIYGLLLLE